MSCGVNSQQFWFAQICLWYEVEHMKILAFTKVTGVCDKLLCHIYDRLIWESNLTRVNRKPFRYTHTSPHFLFIPIYKAPTVVYNPLTTLATMGSLQSSLNIHSHRAVPVVSFDSSHFEQPPICQNRAIQQLVRQCYEKQQPFTLASQRKVKTAEVSFTVCSKTV